MNNVIIQGCGRSGTSILGELFEHLPECNYLFEPQLKLIKETVANESKPIAAKVPKGGTKLTDGLACDMAELMSIMGDDISLIWIIRNPLDTICSLRPGIEDNWSHNPKPPNYDSLLDKPWHIKCAYHWEHINNVGFKSLQKYGQPLVVKYEDLLGNTDATVSTILEFVDSQSSVDDLAPFTQLVSNKVKDSYQAKHQVQWFRDDHKTRIGRYKENMTDSEISECLEIVGKTAAVFDYKY